MVLAKVDGQYFCFLFIPLLPTEQRTLTLPRGVEGDEVQDAGFNLSNARRRSNSSSYTAGLKDFKTKFEQIETEPVFEEEVHGPESEEDLTARRVNSESSEGSVDEEDKVKQ